MRTFDAGQFDIAVIGAGHAGIEAALAAARLGMETICFTINLDAVGNMPCNPAVGGTGKGHLVRELDALGGEMAKAADKACIQYRLLNRGKGPAVHSLRAQADRRLYQQVMKHTLEQQEHLTVRQGEVLEIRLTDGKVSHVVLEKNCEVGWHIHHGDGETYYILKGKGEYSDNGNIVEVYPGDVLFVDDGEGHSMINREDEPLEMIALVLYK